MPSARDTIKIFITGDASGFKKAAGEVQGTTSKMSGAMKGLVAGVSLAAVGKGVMDVAKTFETLAIEAKNVSTATGLSGQQAARWLEASRSIGVDGTAATTALGKMEKQMGKNADVFKKYGVTAVKTASGQVDVNATFIKAIGVLHDMQDPLERQAAGAAMFGKSWQDLAPLVELGAGGVAAALAGVSDAQAKVGDPGNVDKARKFQAAMDNLNDRVDALKITMGEALVPVLTVVADFFTNIPTPVLAGSLAMVALAVAVGKVSEAFTLLSLNPVGAVLAALALTGYVMYRNWDKVTGVLGAIGNAFVWVGDRVLALVDALSKVHWPEPPGWVKAAAGFLGGAASLAGNLASGKGLTGKAMGGPVVAGTPYMVGERGPELFVPGRSGRIIPNGAGGMTVVQYVTVQSANTTQLSRDLARTAAQGTRAAGR